MTRDVAIAVERVFLLVGGGRTVPAMTSALPLLRRRPRSLPDLLESGISVRVDGELRAAVSLDDGRAIANPFVATRDLVDTLRRIAWTS
jgi:hypothetical protein